MKLSVSVSEEDVATLDRYAEAAGLTSRSAAIQRAIRTTCARTTRRSAPADLRRHAQRAR